MSNSQNYDDNEDALRKTLKELNAQYFKTDSLEEAKMSEDYEKEILNILHRKQKAISPISAKNLRSWKNNVTIRRLTIWKLAVAAVVASIIFWLLNHKN